MKYCKFLILTILVFFGLVLGIELYKGYCVSFEEYDYFVVQDLNAEDREYLLDRLNRISDMLSENSLEFFLVNRYGTEGNEQTVEIYCSSATVEEQLISKGRKSGTYESYFSGTVQVEYGSSFLDFATTESRSDSAAIYIVNPPEDYSTLPVNGDYLEEEICPGQRYSVYIVMIELLSATIMVLLIVMTMFDIFLSQKTRAVRVLNGTDIHKIVGIDFIKELVGLGLAIILPVIFLYEKLCVLPCSKLILCMLLVTIIADCLLIVLTGLLINMRVVIAGASNIGRMIVLCQLLQAGLCVGFIVLCTVMVAEYREYGQLAGYEKMAAVYQGYAFTNNYSEEISEETLKEELNQSMIVASYYSYVNHEGIQYESFIVNGKAKDLITGTLGEVFREGVQAVYIPENIYDEYVYDMEHMTQFGSSEITNGLEGCGEIISYAPQESMAWFSYASEGEINLGDCLYIASVEEPIIYYEPLGEEVSDVTHLGLIDHDDYYVGESGIRMDWYGLYQNQMKIKGFTAILLSITVLLLAGMLVGTNILCLNLEYRLNALELCIRKVNGCSLFNRYSTITILLVLSHILGIIMAWIINYGGSYRFLSIGIGMLALVAALILERFLILFWEKNYCVKILKGGAL